LPFPTKFGSILDIHQHDRELSGEQTDIQTHGDRTTTASLSFIRPTCVMPIPGKTFQTSYILATDKTVEQHKGTNVKINLTL